MIGTIELVDNVDHVVGSVRVNQINNDLNTNRMSLVDEEFEIIRCSLPYLEKILKNPVT